VVGGRRGGRAVETSRGGAVRGRAGPLRERSIMMSAGTGIMRP
jgi:hypothetical protein